MTTSSPTSEPRIQDERIIAALAHASAIFPMWGAIAAIVIWATQKEKSVYVAFQSLQAVVYHFVMILAAFLFGFCYMCSAFAMPLSTLLFIPAGEQASGEVNPFFFVPFAFPFVIMALGLVGWIACVVYGLAGAAATLQGKDFKYAIIGRKLESYLVTH